MLACADNHRVAPVQMPAGRPIQNGHVETFHGRLRNESLNASWFRTLDHVRSTLETWRIEYNEERPRSALDYRTRGNSAERSKREGPRPLSLRKPQPSTKRNSSYKWLNRWGRSERRPANPANSPVSRKNIGQY
ncbi:integrase core domain-containing protein [Bryocella elongata]|uniref:integrase core domain-containing protein n=1 Tax=Bryocella elongata TaxID=863522 RepID=UPI000CDF0E17